MSNVIRIANEIHVPVLPVHDEVVFPETQLEIMKYVLAKAFSWTFGSAGDFGSLKVNVSDSLSGERKRCPAATPGRFSYYLNDQTKPKASKRCFLSSDSLFFPKAARLWLTQ